MSRPDKNPWTNDEIAMLRRMRSRGQSFVEISIVIGRSPDSCQTKARNLQIAVLGRSEPREWSRRGVLRGKSVRPCLRCRAPFRSEGPHNRLCGECRRIETSPFEP